MSVKVELIAREGNFFRREISERCLGTQEALLSSLAEDQPIMMPRVIALGDSPLHILASKNSMVMITELKKLPFKTWWALTESGSLRPIWRTVRGAVEIDEPWPVPGYMKVLFALKFNRILNGNAAVDYPYLFCYLDNELRVLPYPNIFPDGKICMGLTWEDSKEQSGCAMNCFLHAHTSFHSTAMNQDLVNDATYALFQRTSANWVFMEKNQIITHSPVASNAFMQGFRL